MHGLIHSDAVTIIVMLVFATSNGFLTSACFMHAPLDVSLARRGEAGSLMALALNAGLTCGALLSFLIRGLLCGCNPFVGG